MPLIIPPDLEAFVEREVAAGRFRSPEDVVSEGLRLLRQREEQADEREESAAQKRGQVLRVWMADSLYSTQFTIPWIMLGGAVGSLVASYWGPGAIWTGLVAGIALGVVLVSLATTFDPENT